MKRILKLTLGFALAITCIMGLAACGDTDGEKITFLNFKPEIQEKYEAIVSAYKEATGNTVQVNVAASGTYEQTLASAMGTPNAPDIFQINGPVGYNNWKDYCADLKDTKLYEYLSDKSLAITSGDGVYGIPYTVEGYGIIYNEALVNAFLASDANDTTYTSMSDVNNFAKLKTLVEAMTATLSDSESVLSKAGVTGVFAATSLKSGEDWRWQTHLFDLPLYYELRDKNLIPATTTPATLDFTYAENYKNIFDLYVDNSTETKDNLDDVVVNTSMADFALQNCVMVQNGNWGASQIIGAEGNKVAAKDIKFLPIYTGVAGEETQGLCIGTENYFAINSKSSAKKQAIAADFLDWLYSSEAGKKAVIEELGFIAPFSTFGDDEKPSDPLSVEVMNWMNKENITSVPWAFSVMPSQTLKDNFGADLLSYVQGNKVWADVVSELKADWATEAGLN